MKGSYVISSRRTDTLFPIIWYIEYWVLNFNRGDLSSQRPWRILVKVSTLFPLLVGLCEKCLIPGILVALYLVAKLLLFL